MAEPRADCKITIAPRGMSFDANGKLQQGEHGSKTAPPVPAAAVQLRAFTLELIALCDSRAKAHDADAHPMNDKFGDDPCSLTAAAAKARESRDLARLIRDAGERAVRDALGAKSSLRVHSLEWKDGTTTYEVRKPGRGPADDYEQGECLAVFDTRAEAEAYALGVALDSNASTEGSNSKAAEGVERSEVTR